MSRGNRGSTFEATTGGKASEAGLTATFHFHVDREKLAQALQVHLCESLGLVPVLEGRRTWSDPAQKEAILQSFDPAHDNTAHDTVSLQLGLNAPSRATGAADAWEALRQELEE